MNHFRIEPNAEARVVAAMLRQKYVALIQEGFTETQALALLMAMLQSEEKQ